MFTEIIFIISTEISTHLNYHFLSFSFCKTQPISFKKINLHLNPDWSLDFTLKVKRKTKREMKKPEQIHMTNPRVPNEQEHAILVFFTLS